MVVVQFGVETSAAEAVRDGVSRLFPDETTYEMQRIDYTEEEWKRLPREKEEKEAAEQGKKGNHPARGRAIDCAITIPTARHTASDRGLEHTMLCAS